MLVSPAVRSFALATVACAPLLAQYQSDFEGLAANAAGTVLTGQDGYYIPGGTMSVDFSAFTYAGNTLGVPANPGGGNQFIAGTGPGSPTFARAQRDMTYGTGLWTAGFDVLAQFNGLLPSAQNLGSFSIQPFPGSQSFIALATWTDPTTAATWDANYVWFDGAGAQLSEAVGDPGFQNLAVNHWYRWETDFDLTTNQIVAVRIIDLTTNTTASFNPVDRYMEGGTLGSATPTGFRFFAGGGVDGNTLAFDNASIDEVLSTCSDLTVVSGSKGRMFSLTGADPNAPAVLLIGRAEGTTVLPLGIGALELGLAHPFIPTMMGLTDASGDASIFLRLPANILSASAWYAQGLTAVFSAPPGRPSISFCTSDVESF